MLKKHAFKILFFLTNLSLAALGVCFFKNQADKKEKEASETETKTIPISQEIIDIQAQIASDRENKLRDLNSAPKEVKKQNIETKTTTTTTTKKPVASSDTKTKTS